MEDHMSSVSKLNRKQGPRFLVLRLFNKTPRFNLPTYDIFLKDATHSLVASSTFIFLWLCKSDLGFNELKSRLSS